ncbi:hypothetical protein O7632_25230 [Solwaraspora sp. WMMD406]|uniref:hypothetical protein n=1 Tax=Solwaraspora sp. WMMD406 TaxID=3016095 RepID=UPI0024168071|nr:hypothetical protein [Solwaraspora sp. WMMD406]MDG4767368.1 hypothetical protein [Solwaraspora sp. WMMD406]
MTDDSRAGLYELLDDIYLGKERVSRGEIARRAVAAELPADLLTRINALPEGEYAQDEAEEVLRQPMEES